MELKEERCFFFLGIYLGFFFFFFWVLGIVRFKEREVGCRKKRGERKKI